MTVAPQPRAMPTRWALVFAIVCALAMGGGGYILGYQLGSTERLQSPERHFVDAVLIPERTGARVWQIRWLAWDEVRIVSVDGDEAKERLVRWLGGQ